MTSQEILEGKRLILDFMGVAPAKIDGIYSWSDPPFLYTNGTDKEVVLTSMAKYAKYDRSLDWIMPVYINCLSEITDLIRSSKNKSMHDVYDTMYNRRFIENFDAIYAFEDCVNAIKLINTYR
jgi:hypothetical protein